MKDQINIGDTVTAYWTINGEQFTGVVLHIPKDTGDMWILRHEQGHITHINPNCSNLEQICKLPTKEAK